jgi:glycosyltransferase involved in cell wall biosynthesis
VRIGYDAKRLFNNFTGLGNYSRFVVEGVTRRFPENEYWLYTPKAKPHPETAPFLKAPFVIRQPRSVLQRSLSSYWRSVSLGGVAAGDGIQVLHGLSNELPVTKPKSLRMVLTVHDLIFKRFPAYYQAVDRTIYSLKLRASIGKADKIVAVSQQTANDLKEFEKVSDDRIVVIQQGCQAVFHGGYPEADIDRLKSKYELPDQFILCVGTMEPRKNAALLIQALSIMREKVFVIIAGKATPYARELQNMVRMMGLVSEVRFIYHIPYTDLPRLYQAASLFVYPSFFEGFGIPIVEAIASGVPVIASDSSSLTEAGGPHCMYTDPEDAEELATMISQVLTDDQLRQTMISKSRDYIRRFEPAVIADQLMDLYRGL